MARKTILAPHIARQDARPRFYFDVHMPGAADRALRRHGFDVVLGRERLGERATDEAYAAEALRGGCVLVSKDSDFLRLHARGLEHSGIVFVSGHASVSGIIEGLLRLGTSRTREEMRGRVEFL